MIARDVYSGGTLAGSFAVHGNAGTGSEGRRVFSWYLYDAQRVLLGAGSDLRSGVGADPTDEEMAASLLSFLTAAAESADHADRQRVELSETENGSLFDEAVTRWAQQHADELSILQEELEMLGCAAREGRDAGRAAASWVFDGNTSDETYEAFRRGLDDGDPAILDQLPHADLSGEWADSPTPRSLAEACGLEEESDPDGTFLQEMCRAYEEAFDAAALAEIERTLAAQL